MDERFDREELRFDEHAQREILDLALKIKAEQVDRASLADLERAGAQLGLSESDIRQAVAKYEGSQQMPVSKEAAGKVEWATFAVMAIHLALQTGVFYRWMHAFWPYESRVWLMLPLTCSLVLGLLVRGSVLRYKRTMAYLVGSLVASAIIGGILHKAMGIGFSISEVPRFMLTVLALETLIVTACSLKALSKEPQETVRQLFRPLFRV